MSDVSQTPYVNRASGAALAFATVTVLLVVVTLGTRFLVTTPAIDADRATVRYQALADMRAAEETTLNTPAWIDQDRQIVRLPVSVALHLAAQAWQNPAQARADLIERANKAAAPLPKVVPQPSAFE